MCTTKAPRQQEAPEPKEVQYLSNPWVDGLGIAGSQTRGRSSLRTDLNRNKRSAGSPRPPSFGPPPGLPGTIPRVPVVRPPNAGIQIDYKQNGGSSMRNTEMMR